MGKKNRRRIERGRDRDKPSDGVVAQLQRDVERGLFLRDGTVKTDRDGQKSAAQIKKEKRNADSLRAHSLRWQAILGDAISHHNAANFNFAEYAIVNRMLTDLLRDMEQTSTRFGYLPLDQKGVTDEDEGLFVTSTHQCCHRFRSFARMKLGMEGTKKDPDMLRAAVADATQAIAISRLLSTVHDTEDGQSSPPPDKAETAALITRGMCLIRLGEYDGAAVDLRAGCAAFSLARESWGGWPTFPEACQQYLVAMAMQKVEDRRARPHYSTEERDSLFKELKLRHYSDERYQCHECGIKPSSSVDLMHCSACMSVWYCSKKCHRRSWRSGHKAVCPLLKASDDSNLLHIIIGKGMTRKILDEGFLLLRNDEQGNGGETFNKATYACRPPGVYHGPFKSENGCTLFELHYYKNDEEF